MRVRCPYCPRRCSIPEGGRGYCGCFGNRGGELVNLCYGRISAMESRPIEIKPFYHFWPNSTAMTFSGFGCNMACPWCQNWPLSKTKVREGIPRVPPEAIVDAAIRAGDQGVCASFNEPIIFGDYLIDVFSTARKAGLYSTMVTNAYMTLEFLDELVKAGLDGISADVKGCAESYRKFQHVRDPDPVFRVLEEALARGVHVEVVYLVVTGANDSRSCYEEALSRTYNSVGPDTPLHINRYFPNYAYLEPPTPMEKLLEIREFAKDLGFRYVYVGNVQDWRYSTTVCPSCGLPLMERENFRLRVDRTVDGRCPRCGFRIRITGRVTKV